jgi:hypothetical protein
MTDRIRAAQGDEQMLQEGSDLCQCGDFRSVHVNGGKCAVCFSSNAPYDQCERFRFNKKASSKERINWDKYHSGIVAAQTDEEYVRARWKRVYFSHGKVIAAFDGIELILGGDYAASAEFTRQREEEIRQLRAEMMVQDTFIGTMALELSARASTGGDIVPMLVTGMRVSRTFARLQRDLAVLLNGWREQDGGTK